VKRLVVLAALVVVLKGLLLSKFTTYPHCKSSDITTLVCQWRVEVGRFT